MTNISVKLTIRELDLLASLASDQLFRREFIDPKLPGHKSVPGDISLGKELVTRLRGHLTPANGVAARRTPPAKVPARQTNAV